MLNSSLPVVDLCKFYYTNVITLPNKTNNFKHSNLNTKIDLALDIHSKISPNNESMCNLNLDKVSNLNKNLFI